MPQHIKQTLTLSFPPSLPPFLPQIRSNYLRHPLSEELDNEEIFLGADAIQVVKYHGSYQQDNREQRKGGEQKVCFLYPSPFYF